MIRRYVLDSIFTWIATIVALAGTILNCKQIKWCFLLWLFTNAMWFAWDIYCGLFNRAIMDAVQFVLAGWGLYEWNKKDRNQLSQSLKN